jgi:hypothetical protein
MTRCITYSFKLWGCADVFDAAAKGNLAKVKAFTESGILADSKDRVR